MATCACAAVGFDRSRPGDDWSFNPPPGWPLDGSWRPPDNWSGPEEDWPAPPPYWTWWVRDTGKDAPAPAGLTPAPQSPYAHWGQRLGGAIIDGLLVYILPWVVSAIVTALPTQVSQASGDVWFSYGILDVLSFKLPALALMLGSPGLVFLFLAQLVLEGRTGQSVGKRLAGIRVVDMRTGRPVGFGMAFARRAYRFVNVLPLGAGFLWPLWDDRRQTLADKLVDTVVVRA